MSFIAASSRTSRSRLLGGGKIAGQKSFGLIMLAGISASFSGASGAIELLPGFDAAIAGRGGTACIANDLRPECSGGLADAQGAGQFFIDWDSGTRRCFVTTSKPIGRVVQGGGPFPTAAAALAAIETTKGC